MQDQRRFIMVAPAPGFTNRVMARWAERERARARRRALVGASVLVGAVSVILLFAAVQLACVVWTGRHLVLSASLNALEALTLGLGALWLVAKKMIFSLDLLHALVGALAVFALTMLWTRVVTGSFQATSNYAGGYGK